MKAIIAILVFAVLLISGCTQSKAEQPSKKLNIVVTPVQNSYNLGFNNTVKAKIKNNENVALYIVSGSPCGGDYYSVKNANGKNLGLHGNLVAEICYNYILEKIAPGEEKIVDAWHLKYYDESKKEFMDAKPGNYTIILNAVLAEDVNANDPYDLEQKLLNLTDSQKQFVTLEVKITVMEYVKESQDQEFEEKIAAVGCTYNQSILNCKNSDLVSTFNCYNSEEIYEVQKGKILNPQLFLFSCPIEAQDLSKEERETYFNCGGGLFYTCKSYLMWDGEKFIQIRNSKELADRIAPIDSEEEALNFVLLSKIGSEELKTKDGRLFEQETERVGNNFLVTIYAPDRTFGCYDKINYEAIQYDVTAKGEITEKSREVVYTEKLGHTLCVD